MLIERKRKKKHNNNYIFIDTYKVYIKEIDVNLNNKEI